LKTGRSSIREKRGDNPVCNLYSVTTNQEAIIRLFRVLNNYIGNMPTFPAVFPDWEAPVVRNGAGNEK
jgi:hypothetical protein